MRITINILLIVISTSLALIGAEVFLRYSYPISYYIWQPNITKLFYPNAENMPGIYGISRFQTNSQGFRADELSIKDDYRILSIGGSTTECLYLDQDEAWPQLTQHTLNHAIGNHKKVWVGNAGMSGRTTRHHLTALRYLDLDALKIDTVVMLIGINDLHKRLGRDEQYDPYFLSRPDAGEYLVKNTFLGGTDVKVDDPFFKKTAIWKLYGRMNRAESQEKGERTIQDQAGKNYSKWRMHRQKSSKILSKLPELSSSLDEYERNVNKIIDIAQARGIRIIFMTQPTLWRANMPEELNALLWMGGKGKFQLRPGHAYYSPEALEKSIARYNKVLLDICGLRQVECIDLASSISKDQTSFYDDVHFNENGSRKVSKILSEYLLAHTEF
jgi:lysophospholipase L1-like esterase